MKRSWYTSPRTGLQALGTGIVGGIAVGGTLSEIILAAAILYVLGGIVLLVLAGAGEIGETFSPERNERMTVGGVGTILVVVGMILAAGGDHCLALAEAGARAHRRRTKLRRRPRLH